MATLLPPSSRIEKDETTAVNVVVQFVSEQEQTLAPAISLPSNTTRDDLELLLNKLSKDDPVPYTFHLINNDIQIPLVHSIQSDLLGHLSPESIFVIRCSPQSVFKVRPATRCSSTLSGHSSPILCASFSSTGTLLATGSGDNHARLWNIDSETPSHTLVGHQGWVLCVEWDPLERLLATGGHDAQIRLWNPKNGKQVGDALKSHSKWITFLAWEPIHINSSPRLASSSKDGTIKIWNTRIRKSEFTLSGHAASVNVVKWGGTVLYSASSDRTIKLWDPKNVLSISFLIISHSL